MADSKRTGAELFVETLQQYGVKHIFGNPGTTELPIVHATEDTDIEYILGLHEDIATGMAGGYASTRRYHAHNTADQVGERDVLPLGVANLHLSAGLAHGLGNIYAASVAGAPVLITAGIHSTDFRHEEPILHGDLVEMTDQFTKWSDEVRSVEALPTMLRRAVRTALTPPTGPVFLALPLDQMLAETTAEPERLGTIPDGGRGDPGQIARAADFLSEGEDVAMVLGDGVARSGRDGVEAAVSLAETVGARVHGEILSCEVNFPTDHDQWVSYIAPDETLARTLMSADVLVQVGCSTNTTLTRHDTELIPPETTCIDISDDAWQIGKNQPADAAVIGDPGRVMSELTDILANDLPESLRESRLESVAARREFVAAKMEGMGEGSATDDPRASKAQLVDAMEDVAGDAYIVDEGVTSKYAMLTRWTLQPDQYISNKGGGLGYGLPASIGAAIAEQMRDDPRDVVGFIGDGSYLYYPQSIYSAVRHDVDLTVVIPDNRNYRILKDNTLDIMGGDEDDYEFVGMDFEPPVDLVTNAESHGATGHLVETPDEIGSTFAEALDNDGTDVLDVLVHD
ncbi:thiamine pyrophosphate-binding protein [Halovenus sp. WSH3]|uniref:Thiamine pyrophosphate-binding protein n=1 Tax=Halovenus carboxidivorans TaxID=2692199 RepID=A0A6B0T6L9_9EURY|nr:thiamine pyrophosphate-binding protein [Halovenus carboxidivorans]MXR52567.1 thiamine pyrophosphate-binding protein [Halovenus carboxidivorans]